MTLWKPRKMPCFDTSAKAMMLCTHRGAGIALPARTELPSPKVAQWCVCPSVLILCVRGVFCGLGQKASFVQVDRKHTFGTTGVASVSISEKRLHRIADNTPEMTALVCKHPRKTPKMPILRQKKKTFPAIL